MQFYSTVLIDGNPIGWTGFEACNLDYAKRAAGYREKSWMIGQRELAVATETLDGLLLQATKTNGTVTWRSRLLDNIVYEKNVLSYE